MVSRGGGFGIKLKIDKSKLQKILFFRKKLIRENIKAVVLNEVIPHVVDLVMEGYDELSEIAEQGVGQDDPSRPSEWRSIFKDHLLDSANSSFKAAEDGTIEIGIGERAFLGDTGTIIDPDDTQPLRWMVFFLEGLVGEFALISPQTYAQLKPSKEFQDEWGRFANEPVFMIERSIYFAQGFNKIIPWDQVRHPFSGFRPPDIFGMALGRLKIRPFINKAIKAAVLGKKL